MKILHVYKDYFPVLGGIEKTVRDLAHGQVRAGHEVTVLVTHPAQSTRREVDEGVRVIRAGRLLTIASTPLSPLLALELARLTPDVTHLHFPYPVGELAHLLFGRARRTVITYHADIVRQAAMLRVYGPLLRRVLAKADALTATSEPYVRTSPWLAPHAGKTTVIPSGIDVDRFAQADPAQVEALRARFAPPSGALFLHVGRLRYYKGLRVALDAMPTVEGRLLVVGRGPEEAALRAQAGRLDLGDRVVFVGDVDDEGLVPYFHAADVFVSASIHRSEAFGLTIIEALASGRPAISTELGTGTSWVNLHEKTGLVVPPNQPVALAAAMNALGRDPAWRARLGAGGQARAEAEFRTETMNERVLALYTRLLGR